MPLSGDGRRFTKIIRTADYECDIHGRMKLNAILQHMQEISSAHLDALGIPHTLLLENRQVFLLSKVGLEIEKRPTASDMLLLQTTPKTPTGAQFIRCNDFYDTNGRLLMHADTLWILVDPDSHRILRPRDFIGGMRYTEDGTSPLLRYRPAAVEAAQVGERAVRFSDLDINNHMNNAVYVDICTDFLPESAFREGEPAKLYIHFRSEARAGDTLCILRGEYGTGAYYLRADKADGICFEAVIRMKKASG